MPVWFDCVCTICIIAWVDCTDDMSCSTIESGHCGSISSHHFHCSIIVFTTLRRKVQTAKIRREQIKKGKWATNIVVLGQSVGPLRDKIQAEMGVRKFWSTQFTTGPVQGSRHRQTSSGKPVSCIEIPKDNDSYPPADRLLQNKQ